MSIRVHVIPNRSSPPAVLLRKTWREGKRIRRQTLANLSKVPPPVVDAIRAVLQDGVVFSSLDQAVTLQRSLPHGHVAALLGLATELGLPRILHRSPSRQRNLALAALIARLIHPASKLATARGLSPDTADSSLGVLLDLGPVSGNEMLDMLDWLRQRQGWIEKSLPRRHLRGATLILYDVTSTYLEGQHCPLAAFGHNRDSKKGKRQMVFGLLCAPDGCPLAVEVFAGNTGDPTTLASQIRKIQDRFRVGRIALVGDRGMITAARIRQDLSPAGLDWISALRTVDIRKLLQAPKGHPAPLRPESLVADTVAEILSPHFPGERLLVCLNPRLRQQSARKREELLQATEARLHGSPPPPASTSPGLRTGTAPSRPLLAKLIATGSKNTSTSPSPTRDCTGSATTIGSRPRPDSMASTWSAPISMPRPSIPGQRWPPTRASPRSSAPFVA